VIPNYADHSANERTFLAWVRTVVAIEGFGLVAARVGDGPTRMWSEIALLAAGGLVLVVAFMRMRHIRRHIDSDRAGDDDQMIGDALLLVIVAGMFGLIVAFGLHIG